MSRPAKSVLPYEPVRRRLEVMTGKPRHGVAEGCLSSATALSSADEADLLGANRDTVRQWASRGIRDRFTADRIAVAVDLTPHVLWGDDWEDADPLPEITGVCLDVSCPLCGMPVHWEDEAKVENQWRSRADVWCPEHGTWRVTVGIKRPPGYQAEGVSAGGTVGVYNESGPRAASTAGGQATTHRRGSDMDEHTSPSAPVKTVEP